MVDRRKENTAECKKRYPAKDGVKGCKQLGSIGFELINRPHVGQDHRCVQECVNLVQIGCNVITNGANCQRKYHKQTTEQPVPPHSNKKISPR
jgi:hypothetical protein